MNTQTLQIRFAVITGVVAMLAMVIVPFGAFAATSTVWNQGFETNTDGWFDGITRVASGTNAIAAAEGSWYAVPESGSYSRFDGYKGVWTGEWVAEVDVYLDPAWTAGEGFDYSVAANGSDGNHQRDYIFHVAKDTSTGKLLVAGSNNTNFAVREDLESLNNQEVTEAGWYTLQHRFYDDGGSLSVDLNLLDDEGNTLFTETRSNVADTIPAEVGGNRYSWFTVINVDGGIAVDNHKLAITTPFVAGLAITAPGVGSTVSGEVTFTGVYTDEDDNDSVQWAVRSGTCAAGTGTVYGNVDGKNTPFDWDHENFSATIDMSGNTPGTYCFVLNPTEDQGDTNLRATREFTLEAPVVEPPTPTSPETKDQCKKGGWATFTDPSFKNQGQCIKYVEHLDKDDHEDKHEDKDDDKRDHKDDHDKKDNKKSGKKHSD